MTNNPFTNNDPLVKTIKELLSEEEAERKVVGKGKTKDQEEGDEDSTVDDDGEKTKKEKVDVNPEVNEAKSSPLMRLRAFDKSRTAAGKKAIFNDKKLPNEKKKDVKEESLDEKKSFDIDMQGTRGQRGKHSVTARTEKEALYKVRRKEGLQKTDVYTSRTLEVEPITEPVAEPVVAEPAVAEENIIMQLRKVVSIGKGVKFSDGLTENVNKEIARDAQLQFLDLKTADEKEAWMEEASASLESLTALVEAKIEIQVSGDSEVGMVVRVLVDGKEKENQFLTGKEKWKLDGKSFNKYSDYAKAIGKKYKGVPKRTVLKEEKKVEVVTEDRKFISLGDAIKQVMINKQ